ncbi:unnamed protein product [Lota lota]
MLNTTLQLREQVLPPREGPWLPVEEPVQPGEPKSSWPIRGNQQQSGAALRPLAGEKVCYIVLQPREVDGPEACREGQRMPEHQEYGVKFQHILYMCSCLCCALHSPLTILCHHTDPQPEASITTTYRREGITSRETPMVKYALLLHCRSMRWHCPDTLTLLCLCRLGSNCSPFIHTWWGRSCRRPSGTTAEATVSMPVSLRKRLYGNFLPF